MRNHIFISYSKKDSDFALKLADHLSATGHKIWIDRSLQVGEDWAQTIESKLEEAKEVIVLLSANSLASKWVQHEGSIAYGLKKPMFPVLIEEVSDEDMPLWAEKFQYHSFVGVAYEKAFDALNAVLTPPNPIQDLLDQQVNAYSQTGELMGAAILKVTKEAFDTLTINELAEELIEKSNQAIKVKQQKELEQQQRLEKTRQQRTIVLTIGLVIALILSLISFSLYRESNQNLDDANIANTQVINERGTAFAERSNAEAASTQAVIERDAAEAAQVEAEYQQSLAEEQTRQAQSGQLAVIALNKIESEFDLALLLSIEGVFKDDNFLSHDSLLTAVQHNPNLLRYFHNHSNDVNSVAFSPDGKVLASGSNDLTVRLWDVTTGQQIGEALTGHTHWVNSVAFGPDGQMLASGSTDKTIRMWNVTAGQQIGDPLVGHTGGVLSMAISPDGQMLASGSDDQTIRLWDVSTGRQIGEPLMGHTGLVNSVAFSPDGQMLASGSRDNTIRLWDVSTGQQIGEPLMGHTNWVNSVALSPNGQMLASGSTDETIRLWNLHTGGQIGDALSGHTDWVNSVAFSPDGQMLASGSDDGTIRLWDVNSGQQIGEAFTGHTDWVNSVAFSPDGQMLASGSPDNTIQLHDTNLNSWIETACKRASRNFTESEWITYLPDECYRQTCPQYPPEFEDERPVCQENK